jgi:hypothetical protein
MRPLKPEEKAQVLARFSSEEIPAVMAELDEYQELLSRVVREDPDLQAAPQAVLRRESQETRLRELHARLFGPIDEGS